MQADLQTAGIPVLHFEHVISYHSQFNGCTPSQWSCLSCFRCQDSGTAKTAQSFSMDNTYPFAGSVLQLVVLYSMITERPSHSGKLPKPLSSQQHWEDSIMLDRRAATFNQIGISVFHLATSQRSNQLLIAAEEAVSLIHQKQ